MRLAWSFVLLAACGEVKSSSTDAPGSIDARDPDGRPIDARSVDAPSLQNGTLSFEDLIDGNVPVPFTFAQNVKLTQPNPNPTDSDGLIAVDCKDGSGGFFGFTCAANGGSIPDGKVFLGFGGLGFAGRKIEITFPADLVQFSVAITNSGGQAGQTYAVAGLDAGNTMVTGTTIQTVAITGWPANRATLQSQLGFRKVQITNPGAPQNVIVIDDARWVAK